MTEKQKTSLTRPTGPSSHTPSLAHTTHPQTTDRLSPHTPQAAAYTCLGHSSSPLHLRNDYRSLSSIISPLSSGSGPRPPLCNALHCDNIHLTVGVFGGHWTQRSFGGSTLLLVSVGPSTEPGTLWTKRMNWFRGSPISVSPHVAERMEARKSREVPTRSADLSPHPRTVGTSPVCLHPQG